MTFTPVIVMTFEFCQRGATVDTPFLTILKTWTSPLEHSVIIHICARLEFPEPSATRLASGSLDSTVLCLVLHQTLVFLLWRAGNGFWDIPTLHRPWLEATGCVMLPSAKCDGRPAGQFDCMPAILMAGRPSVVFNRYLCRQLAQLSF